MTKPASQTPVDKSKPAKDTPAGTVSAAATKTGETQATSAGIAKPTRFLNLFLEDVHTSSGEGTAPISKAQVARLKIDGELIYDRELHALLLTGGIKDADLPGEENAFKHIKAYDKLVLDWEAKLKEWEAKKVEIDAEHAKLVAQDEIDFQKALVEYNAKIEADAQAEAAAAAAAAAAPPPAGKSAAKKTAPPKKKAPPPLPQKKERKPPTYTKAPEKPPITKEAVRGLALIKAWDDYRAQLKAAVELDPGKATDEDLVKAVEKLLTRSNFKEKSFSWASQAHRAHLNKFLEDSAVAKAQSSDKGKIVIPLNRAEPKTTSTVVFELSHKFTEPQKNKALSDLGLEAQKGARSAHFDPKEYESNKNDWFLARKQKSAWSIKDRTGASRPLFNWHEVSHEWAKPADQDESFDCKLYVLHWCQPVWYWRIPGRHGTAPIVPLDARPGDNKKPKQPALISAPVLEDGEWGKIPTLLISTSDTVPHGRQYGRNGREGRVTECNLVFDLRTWEGPGKEKKPLWYVYSKQKPIPWDPSKAVWHEKEAPKDANKPDPDHPPHPDGPAIRTFKKKTPPAPTPEQLAAAEAAKKDEKKDKKKEPPPPTWVQVHPAGGAAPPHILVELEKLNKPEGTEVTVNCFTNGTQSLQEAITQLWLLNGGDPVLKGDNCNPYMDEYRRVVVKQFKPNGEVDCYRAVEYFGETGIPRSQDPDYTFPYPHVGKTDKRTIEYKVGKQKIKEEVEFDLGHWAARETNKYRWHRGIDVAGFVGHPLFAIRPGKVSYKGGHSSYSGGQVTLNISGSGETDYLHCHVDDPTWKAAESIKGWPVKAGDVIALMGRTGSQHAAVSATHVHMNGFAVSTGSAGEYAGLMPHNEMTEELICQTEFGHYPEHWLPAPDSREVNKCFGRTLIEGAPVPRKQAETDVRLKEGGELNVTYNKQPWVFPTWAACWAFNQFVCPRQALVEAERKRQMGKKYEKYEAPAAPAAPAPAAAASSPVPPPAAAPAATPAPAGN